jgi:N,N-dimethylformamidase beta subunit-like protein
MMVMAEGRIALALVSSIVLLAASLIQTPLSSVVHFIMRIDPAILYTAPHTATISIIHSAYAAPENQSGISENASSSSSSSNTGSQTKSENTENTTNNEEITVLPPKPQSLIAKNRNFVYEPLGLLPAHDIASFLKTSRIALVVPVFTYAAYGDAFYQFYSHFAETKARENVTHNLSLLSNNVIKPRGTSEIATEEGSAMSYLAKHLSLLPPSSHVNVLTDIGVDNGSIFQKNGVNKYDILILGHQEYVTQQEYNNLKRFVADGGILILLDGNIFFAQVGYDSYTHTVTLIKGHGSSFNGKSAWPAVSERWKNETSRWVGSNFLCYPCQVTFANNPFNYTYHEDQYLSNPNDTILLNYNASFLGPGKIPSLNTHSYMIATYVLDYLKGDVISLIIYSDDIIANRAFLVFFDHLIAASRVL